MKALRPSLLSCSNSAVMRVIFWGVGNGEWGVGSNVFSPLPIPTPYSPLLYVHFFPLYVTLQTFFPPSSTTSNDPSRIILTPTGRPHTSWPDSSGTQPVRKFS